MHACYVLRESHGEFPYQRWHHPSWQFSDQEQQLQEIRLIGPEPEPITAHPTSNTAQGPTVKVTTWKK